MKNRGSSRRLGASGNDWEKEDTNSVAHHHQGPGMAEEEEERRSGGRGRRPGRGQRKRKAQGLALRKSGKSSVKRRGTAGGDGTAKSSTAALAPLKEQKEDGDGGKKENGQGRCGWWMPQRHHTTAHRRQEMRLVNERTTPTDGCVDRSRHGSWSVWRRAHIGPSQGGN
mmetsp:Transcript_42990/g.66053  ORF Transcript_42990/g.66053 Transcript_42990/m.66053 type:complete len:169 (-) Transcript_42990:702-1208(-)